MTKEAKTALQKAKERIKLLEAALYAKVCDAACPGYYTLREWRDKTRTDRALLAMGDN